MNDPALYLKGKHAELIEIRHDIHQHPETAFEEVRTSDLVAKKLESYGIEVNRGLAQTGVVGTLRSGKSQKSIGLRADMDALHIDETNSFKHKSKVRGKMHACGHDGHTTMLLGAAEYLAKTRNFDGTVHFIFQPAEENEGGGQVMVEQGLFDKHPMDAVFGMHNIPHMELGTFATKPGVMMAGFDRFDIEITGNGGHAAMPQKSTDPIVAAASLVSALQSVISRGIDPMNSAVLSVTRIQSGDTYNVIPEKATLSGTVRYFEKNDKREIERRITNLSNHIAQAYDATARVNYMHGYPPTENSAPEAKLCQRVLQDVFGDSKVNTNPRPLPAAEDFSFMLEAKPGCYIWAGNGLEGAHVHNPNYDFNDELLPLGALYWIKLAETALPAS